MIRIFKLLNAPCRDIAALVSRAMDERLTPGERFAVRLHLLYCKACRRYRKQIAQLRQALAQWRDAESAAGASTALTQDARKRLQTALDQARPDAPK